MGADTFLDKYDTVHRLSAHHPGTFQDIIRSNALLLACPHSVHPVFLHNAKDAD